ncbi:MAG: TRAP transporter small permease [Synergistaceae bacterium]|nr:TRAP transporter small permease [Synergistaceae bacterium]
MIVKGFRSVLRGMHWIAAFLYLTATAAAFVNVITRYFFRFVIFGSEEFCSFLVIIMAYLMFPIIEAEDRHLRIDIFENAVKNHTIKEIVRVFRGIVTAGVCGTIAFYGLRTASVARRFGAASTSLQIPMYILFGITTASFVFMVLGWICSLFFNKRRPL